MLNPIPGSSRVRGARGPHPVTLVLVAGAAFCAAYADGSYGLVARAMIGIGAWWAVILGVGLGLWPVRRPTGAALAVGALLASLAAWTFASVAWSWSAEASFNEFTRLAMYLGLFAVVVLSSSRGTTEAWLDGLALAITAIAVLALASRLFPGLVGGRGLSTFLPSAQTRLSFPLGYWNGLGIFVALGLPLLLRRAWSDRRGALAAAAVAPFPVIAATIYLTSSRGAVVTAGVGVGVALALAPRRWEAVAAATAGVGGGIVSVLVVADRQDLTNAATVTDAVRSEGRSAALLIALTCVGAALACVGLRRVVALPQVRRRGVGIAVAVVAGVVVVAGALAADPAERFRAFKRLPTNVASPPGDFVRAHLLSGNGSGRWQFWASALDEWRSNPVAGRGAGTYESWWAQHGSFPYFLRDAHSLYLEVLGELGIVGFALLVAALATSLVVGARRYADARDELERGYLAALLAVAVAWAVAAGIDWIWELTSVTAVAVASFGLLTGPATDATGPTLATARSRRGRGRRSFGPGVALLVGGWLLICLLAVPLLAQVEIGNSQDAVRRGDARSALDDARKARNIQPWASSPYLQLALVAEQQGELDTARSFIDAAIDRDPRNWRLWLVAARLETKAGAFRAGAARLAQAERLNPRSPLFTNLRTGAG